MNFRRVQIKMFTEEYVTTEDGVRIFCRVQREAGRPWLVFLHGGGGSLSSWYQEEAFFSNKTYSLMFIDMRGHGNSDKGSTRGFFALGNFSRDLATVLKRFGIKKATIIGHCFGSVVTQQFCSDYPGMVNRIVLINSGKEPFKGIWRKLIPVLFCAFVYCLPFRGVKGHANYSKFVGSYDIHVQRFFTDLYYAGRLTCSSTYRITTYFRSHVKKFSKPALLIHGRDDIIVPYKNSFELQQVFTNSTVKILNTNHLSVYNDGPAVSRTIFEFLESDERRIGKGWKSRT